MHQHFLIDLHSILENTKPNSADYDSAVTDLADTVFTSADYEDDLAYIEHLFIHEGENKNNRITFTVFYLLSVIYRRVCDRQNYSHLLRLGQLGSIITSISSLFISVAMSSVIPSASLMPSC